MTVRGPNTLTVQMLVLVVVILIRPSEDHGHWSGQIGARSPVERVSFPRSRVCANAASGSKLVVPPPTNARRKKARLKGRISNTSRRGRYNMSLPPNSGCARSEESKCHDTLQGAIGG